MFYRQSRAFRLARVAASRQRSNMVYRVAALDNVTRAPLVIRGRREVSR